MTEKTANSEKEESKIKDEKELDSKDKKFDLDYIDWIFDKGWLRTKK